MPWLVFFLYFIRILKCTEKLVVKVLAKSVSRMCIGRNMLEMQLSDDDDDVADDDDDDDEG